MEDQDLDLLTNLIDDNDDFDENELASMDSNEKQTNFISDSCQETRDIKEKKEEEVTKKLTEMENYIKFLESQLKTQNSDKKKSPESKSNVDENKKKPTSIVSDNYKNSSNDKGLTQNVKKESQSVPTKSSPTIRQRRDDPSISKNARIAHTPKTPGASTSQKIDKKTAGIKRKAEGPAAQASAPKRSAQDMNGVTDVFSGLRIVNPLVSSATMERRMEGRRMIKISSIQQKIRNNDIEGDWVTIGVLVQKLPPKTSAKGNQYSIWKISDLAFHLESSIISLFLFGESHKEHWKTSEGTVIALLNPSILPSREKQSKDVAVTIDNPKKMMMMGVSQDFGRCQGARKADGSKCSNFVNKAFGEFCEYHVRTEYKKMRSKRMECQQGYGAPSKSSGNKLKQRISSETFFYQGKMVSSSMPPPKKEKVTLKSLAANASVEHLSAWKGKQEEKSKSNAGNSSSEKASGPSEDFLNLLKIPTVGSRNLMRQLHREEEKDVEETRQIVSASEFLKANKVERGTGNQCTSSRTSAETTSKAPLPKTPVLGRGLNCNDDLIFDENVPLNFTKKKSTDTDKGKRQALALLRETGPFTPKDPNDARAKKPSPKLQNSIKAKLETDQSPVTEVGKKASTFTLADGFDIDSVEGQRILKAKSRHVGEVKQAEIEEELKYFESREKKEAMEDKMKTIRKLKVKVVHCPECKYVAEKPSANCISEKHNLKQMTVFKKFFACKDCKERTVCYGQRYPSHECRKCGAKNYEKCSMWQEKSGPKVGGETLLIRGPEYSKFLNSLQTPKTNGVLPKYL